jgi:FAD/FMN-containing dehydrogenase
MKTWLRRLLILSVLVCLVVVVLLARPALHLSKASRFERDERTPIPAGHVDDASRLNQTAVAEVWPVAADNVDAEKELAQLLQRAEDEKLRVSISGAKHSMGGHTIYPDGIAIDMLPWKRMELSDDRDILHVQSGALWSDVIAFLEPHGKSVSVMQSNNAFTVGGSLSVNCHGWQFDRPSIASTVESMRVMLADGSVKNCSRTQNQELFSLVLGGYGLFGIILDVDLRVVPNERYRLTQQIVPATQAIAVFDELLDKHDAQMAFGRMNIVPNELFEEVIINSFRRELGEVPALKQPGKDKLRRAVFRGSAENDYGKGLRWSMETQLQPWVAGESFSRNQLLNEGVELFQNRSAVTTDILHEYFVPRSQVASFVTVMRKILSQHNDDNLLNVTVRLVNEDTDTFLRYADQQMLAFVMLFVQERTPEGEKQMCDLTRELTDCALKHGGRYYLPYRLHATPEQFHQAYPQAKEFFELKRQYDPEELFQNQFYRKYGKVD